MVAVFREVRRVLKPDGVLFLNLGDSYCGGGNYRGVNENTLTAKQRSNRGSHGELAIGQSTAPPALRVDGLKSKDLVGIPWRVAFALQADGWYLRSDIIWSKPNPMPESVTDRPTKAHEYVFLLTKSARYYWDAEAVAETGTGRPRFDNNSGRAVVDVSRNDHARHNLSPALTRNVRSVWTIPTQAYAGAHFAVMPEKLVEPCILAGSKPGDLVLDPFGGSGTVGRVARRFCRRPVMVELNPAYLGLARRRMSGVQAELLSGEDGAHG